MNRVEVRPELLRWARGRAGLDLERLRGRFPRLEEWERLDAFPTLRQLEEFAKATYTPLGYLFLAAPPVDALPIPDFRTLSGGRVRDPSPNLLDTIYLCQQRQDWYRDFARIHGEGPRSFVGSVSLADDVVDVAGKIRRALGLDLEERRNLSTWTDALRRLVEQADELGILVMASGVVGSNSHRHLDPEEFRGFALSDPLAPLVFLNGADSKAAQMFTLAHELAHIWLGESAVSNDQALLPSSFETERWCNRVAAELLVPLETIRPEFRPGSDLRSEAKRLAGRFKVSTLVILRRIHDAGAIDRGTFGAAYEQEVARLRAIPRPDGGNFYLSLGARASRTLTRALVTSTIEGQTSFTEAFRLLGLKKMSTFRELASHFGTSF